jgi:Mn2+/Fe2+ NRAMP family transporter
VNRWQLATGTTLVEGCVAHFGRPAPWLFLAYLMFWSFMVAAALMSGIGVTCHAIYPLTGVDVNAANVDKIIYGILHSALAVLLVRLGGYRLFEVVMSVCISLMFGVVILTAVALRPDLGEVARGLVLPTIPDAANGGAAWTLALIGGVGGTVTVLCYGYWIREEGRYGTDDLKTCRIDLATAYLLTAIFGVAMVVIGNSLGELEGGGAKLIVEIAHKLESTFGGAGPVAKWAFLIGAWGAVFSSLLGVWQSVPYLFADLWQLMQGARPSGAKIDTNARPYRAYLYAIAVVPILGMVVSFQAIQMVYAVVGAMFVPMLAVTLLLLNGRTAWIGRQYRNRWPTVVVLVGTVLFFVYTVAVDLIGRLAAA